MKLVNKKLPRLRAKSGQWHWLNDWRIKKLQMDQDLADQLKKLMKNKGRLLRISSARMNNFITDFLADQANKGLMRVETTQAWNYIKSIPSLKSYACYKELKK